MTASTGEQSPFMESSAPMSPRPEHATHSARESFSRLMLEERLPGELIDLFLGYHGEIEASHTGLIGENDILPAKVEDFTHLDSLTRYAPEGRKLMHRAVCIRLNGGLGTSMGMTHAKSLLPARHDRSFLDIIHGQAEHQRKAHGGASPLLFMNSYATHADTLRALESMAAPEHMPRCFLQHRFPKVDRATLLPVRSHEADDMAWNPPGHGDIYAALVLSGMLDALLSEGRRWALVANADNLGASLDPAILGYMAAHRIPFLMECARRTPADSKGGHLARTPEGGLVLREVAQCPADDMAHFQDIHRYGLFNTNNIWLDLAALRDRVERYGLLRLPLILNPKTLDPRDPESTPVWQVETAMGAAIALFPGATAIVTPRRRFLPVKRCNDLLLLWSDCFSLGEDFHLNRRVAHDSPLPRIDLDPKHYGTWDRLMQRFPHGAPAMRSCTAMQVRGDVRFGDDVALDGEVRIRNSAKAQAVIPDGTRLSGEVHL